MPQNRGMEEVQTKHGRLRGAQIQTVPSYAAELRARLQPFYIRVPDPDAGLLADSDLYEEVRQDPVVTHALEYLALMVAGTEWDVLPAAGDARSERLVPFVKGALDRIHDFAWVRKYLVDAVLMGMAVGKKVRVGPQLTRLAGDVCPRWWTLVEAIEPVDKRMLEIERDWRYEDDQDEQGKTGTVIAAPHHYWKMYDVYNLRWWIIEDRSQVRDARLAHQDFVWHFSENRQDRVGYGRGVLEILYTCIRIKSHLTQYRAAFCEKHAMPWLLAKVDVMRRVSSAALASGDIQQLSSVTADWLDMLTQMQGRHVGVCDKQDEIEVIEAKGSGPDYIADFIDYLDRVITQLILGATLNTQQQTGGTTSTSMAQSKIHESSTDSVVKYHRTRLEETIRDDIVRGFIRDNYTIFAAMGLADAEPPRVRLQDDRKLDPQIAAQMIQVAAQLGLGEFVGVDESLEILHLKRADKGEAVLGSGGANMEDVIGGSGGMDLKVSKSMGDPSAPGDGQGAGATTKPNTPAPVLPGPGSGDSPSPAAPPDPKDLHKIWSDAMDFGDRQLAEAARKALIKALGAGEGAA